MLYSYGLPFVVGLPLLVLALFCSVGLCFFYHVCVRASMCTCSRILLLFFHFFVVVSLPFFRLRTGYQPKVNM